MPTRPRRRPRLSAAFTLIELLLVLLILAILAGLVGWRVVGVTAKAKVSAAKTDLATLQTAIKAFDGYMGRLPSSSEGLQGLIVRPSEGGDDWQKCLEKDVVPQDPWKHDWNYREPGSHNPDGYDLWSNGPDGREGTEDDIGNWTPGK